MNGPFGRQLRGAKGAEAVVKLPDGKGFAALGDTGRRQSLETGLSPWWRAKMLAIGAYPEITLAADRDPHRVSRTMPAALVSSPPSNCAWRWNSGKRMCASSACTPGSK